MTYMVNDNPRLLISSKISNNRAMPVPFPNGESYMQTNARMKSFLEDLKRDYDGKRVMVIGHRALHDLGGSATQYGIQNIVEGTPYEKLVSEEALDAWKWQPG